MDLVSRSGWGARPWRSPNGGIKHGGPRRGVKVHYLGTPYSSRPHSQCAAYVRQVQAQHMDGNGWSDVGYSFLVCEHGTVYEGRGLTRRNSANGTAWLNEAHYAVLALHGTSGQPPDALLRGLRDAIDHCRTSGPAGGEIRGHRDGHPTACPGGPLYAWVQAGAPRPGGSPAPKPPPDLPEEDDMPERALYGTTGGYRLVVPPNTRRQLTFDRVYDAQGWREKSAEPSIVFGPCFYSSTLAIRAEGLTRGQEVQIQFAHYRRSADDSGWERSGGMPISSPVHDGGSLHAVHVWQSHITGGRRGRVRAEVQHFGDQPITITYARAETLFWRT